MGGGRWRQGGDRRRNAEGQFYSTPLRETSDPQEMLLRAAPIIRTAHPLGAYPQAGVDDIGPVELAAREHAVVAVDLASRLLELVDDRRTGGYAPLPQVGPPTYATGGYAPLPQEDPTDAAAVTAAALDAAAALAAKAAPATRDPYGGV